MNVRGTSSLHAAMLVSMLVGRAFAHDPPGVDVGCDSPPPGMAREIALMQSPALPEPTTRVARQPPRLYLDRHYALSLSAQGETRFRIPPQRAPRNARAQAGVYEFKVPIEGRYRVSITSRHWIDIVDGGKALPSVGHHQPGCGLVHKVVEFDLPSGRVLTLQLSGREDTIVGLAITYVPS